MKISKSVNFQLSPKFSQLHFPRDQPSDTKLNNKTDHDVLDKEHHGPGDALDPLGGVDEVSRAREKHCLGCTQGPGKVRLACPCPGI